MNFFKALKRAPELFQWHLRKQRIKIQYKSKKLLQSLGFELTMREVWENFKIDIAGVKHTLLELIKNWSQPPEIEFSPVELCWYINEIIADAKQNGETSCYIFILFIPDNIIEAFLSKGYQFICLKDAYLIMWKQE